MGLGTVSSFGGWPLQPIFLPYARSRDIPHFGVRIPLTDTSDDQTWSLQYMFLQGPPGSPYPLGNLLFYLALGVVRIDHELLSSG